MSTILLLDDSATNLLAVSNIVTAATGASVRLAKAATAHKRIGTIRLVTR